MSLTPVRDAAHLPMHCLLQRLRTPQKERPWEWRMAQQLKAFAVLPKDLCSVPSSHVKRLANFVTRTQRNPTCSSDFQKALTPPTHTHTLITIIKINLWKTIQPIVIGLACLPEWDVKALLLNTPYTLVTEYKEMKTKLNWKLPLCLLVFTVQEDAMQATTHVSSLTAAAWLERQYWPAR